MKYDTGRMVLLYQMTSDQVDRLHVLEGRLDRHLTPPEIRDTFKIDTELPTISMEKDAQINQGFVKNVLSHIQTLPDNEFDKMSEDAQIKYNCLLDFIHSCDQVYTKNKDFQAEVASIVEKKAKRGITDDF